MSARKVSNATKRVKAENEHYVIDPKFADESDDSSWGVESDDEEENEKWRKRQQYNDEENDEEENVTNQLHRLRLEEEGGGEGEESGEMMRMMKQKNALLMEELKHKKRQVYELSVLLEAIEPIPGLGANRFAEILKDPGCEGLVDYRDKKIVHLAKKCRMMNLSVTKLKSDLAVVMKEKEKGKKEEEQGARRRGGGLVTQKEENEKEGEEDEEAEEVSRRLQQEIAGWQKQVADLRHRLGSSQQENKRLHRTLSKEIGGNGGSSDPQKVYEQPGWRGRAQQIIMLKARVKKLEQGLSLAAAAGGGGANFATISTTSLLTVDVDRRAQEELQCLQQDNARHDLVQEKEKEELKQEAVGWKMKYEASKARISILEGEMNKSKDQIKFLLIRSKADHELIDVLRKEVTSAGRRRSNQDNEEGGHRIRYKTLTYHGRGQRGEASYQSPPTAATCQERRAGEEGGGRRNERPSSSSSTSTTASTSSHTCGRYLLDEQEEEEEEEGRKRREEEEEEEEWNEKSEVSFYQPSSTSTSTSMSAAQEMIRQMRIKGRYPSASKTTNTNKPPHIIIPLSASRT